MPDQNGQKEEAFICISFVIIEKDGSRKDMIFTSVTFGDGEVLKGKGGQFSFPVQIDLPKDTFCEKCLSQMKEGETVSTNIGLCGVSTVDTTTYTCQSCGHIYKQDRSRD